MGKARQILTRGNIPIRSRLRPLRLDLHYTFFARLTSFRRSCERVGATPVPPPRGSSLEMEIYPAFRAKRWRSMLGYHVSSRGAGLGWRCFSICTAYPSKTGRVAQPNTSGVHHPSTALRAGSNPGLPGWGGCRNCSRAPMSLRATDCSSACRARASVLRSGSLTRGPALNKSAEMPRWGYTLSKSDIAVLVAYVRAVADPPYEAGGLVYAQK